MKGAAKFGYRFTGRTQTDVRILTPEGEKKVYVVKEMIAFTSARKRMSVIVEERPSSAAEAPLGSARLLRPQMKLYIKGADNIILSRLHDGGPLEPHYDETLSHIKQFAEGGLRTLCLAYKDLTHLEYQEWQQKFNAAKNSLVDRDDMIDKAADEVRCLSETF